MKIGDALLAKYGGLAVAAAVRGWMSTLQYTAALYDETVDPIHPEFRGPIIFVLWHEYMVFPFYLRSHCNLALLVSRHRDAEWLSQAARRMGMQTVRGSTYGGGGMALRQLLRVSGDTSLVVTPDGPRGPRRRLAQGPIYLSARLQIPLVLMAFGYHRPWRLRSWDRFAIPRPFSSARAVISPRLQIPPNLERAGVEHYRQRVEALLNRLTSEAEAWAEAGTRKVNQRCAWRQAAPSRRGRVNLPQEARAGRTRGAPSAHLSEKGSSLKKSA